MSGNLARAIAVVGGMNAYFWRTGENIVHHMRAESVADVRERIAATLGDEVARRAVITSLEKARTGDSKSAAA
jgi:uncharacterized small protein (DUF1192 family)